MMLEHGLDCSDGGRDARRRGLRGARRRAADSRPAAARRRCDVARVHIAGRLRLPAVPALGGCGMKMNGADAILRSLEAEGVDVVFGLPGGAILPLYDAMARGTTVRHVLARHEQGAGHMAQGYARASGRVGVAVATSGTGRDKPRHADRRRLDGLDAARLHHRTGADVPDRHRCVPGMRHHRHHDPDRQALVARAGRRRAAARSQGRLPRCAYRPLRPGARRCPARRAGGRIRLLLPRQHLPPGMETAPPRTRTPDRGCCFSRCRGGAAHPLCRRRSPECARDRRAPRARGVGAASRSSRR